MSVITMRNNVPLLALAFCTFIILFPAESDAGVSFHPLARENGRASSNKKPSTRRDLYAGVMDTEAKGNHAVGDWVDPSPQQPVKGDRARSGEIQDILLQALAYFIEAYPQGQGD
ncbi:uncharacterized protein LOC103190801 isoform X1 [Callorhinchus milii]|uniref:uncharacterized protein LOC103190801 isoform X1 n=1 Tax=Callorhinchus milii TaxID=7868 RepID=UPI0004571FFC|nr:uncharacterized protein LOC103190801 isoform X1 [Callorhinchus milii]|eukprot:gi/632985799/ref/XP_007909884.1/ PREDICTED: uncharacterized protein LOC103190801 isoform X1 [Callorhinchus milii]